MKMMKKGILLMLCAVFAGVMALALSPLSFAATSVSKLKVSSISDVVYNGKAQKPALKVKKGSKTLKNGKDYTLKYAKNKNVGYATVTVKGKGSYTGSKTVKFKIVSPAVKNLKFSKPSKTSVTLTWSKSAKATGYQIYKYSGSSYKLASTVRTNKLTLSKLSAGNTYKVKVRPYNKLSSGDVIYGPFCSVMKVLTLPSDAGKLTQTAAANTGASFTWSQCKGASGYTVYTVSSAGKAKAVKSVKDTSFKLTGLKGDTKVCVAAYRKINGEKAYSAKSPVATMAVIPSGKVEELKVSGVTTSSLTLKWKAISGCKYYMIYKSTDGENYTLATAATSASKKLTGLYPCTTYSFKVCTAARYSKTYFESGKFCDSVEATTTPGSIGEITAYSVTNTGFKLTWTKAVNVTGYELYAYDKETEDYVLKGTLKTTTAAITGLNEKSAYKFKGRSYYQKDDKTVMYGAWSPVVTVKTDDSLADGVSISCASASLWMGEEMKLTAAVTPSYTKNKKLTWSSSAPKTASVDGNGTVTGIAPGKAVITATAADTGKVSDSVEITVTRKVTGVKLEKTSLNLSVKETTALVYEVLPYDATDKSVSYSSSNVKVATVSDYGLITAKAAGSATITVSSVNNPAAKATCKLTVRENAVTSISVPSELTIYVGQTYPVTPVFTPSNASNKSFTVTADPKQDALGYAYRASDYIKTTSSGVGIVGVKATSVKPAAYKVGGLISITPDAPKKFTLTVRSANGKTAKCNVKVINAAERTAVRSVKVETAVSLWYPGKTGYMYASVEPADATDTNVKWSSSNKKIAVVDADGKVTALKPGTVTLKAVTRDGSKAASKKIRIVERITPSQLVLSAYQLDNLMVGDTCKLTATVLPESANDRSVTFRSDKPSVVSCSGGTLTALKEGKAEITVTTSNGLVGVCSVDVHTPGVRIEPGTYFEGCKPGDTLKLSATAYCSGVGRSSVVWASDNEQVATVEQSGLVTVCGEGRAKIIATCLDNGNLYACAGVTTDVYALPDASDTVALFNIMKTSMNRVKEVDRPAYSLEKISTISDMAVHNFDISGIIGTIAGLVVTDEDINAMLSDLIQDELASDSVIMPAAPSEAAKNAYCLTLPISETTCMLSSDFNTSAIKSCSVSDRGDTVDMTFTLKDEKVTNLPSLSTRRSGTFNTNHGRAFDLLYKENVDLLFQKIGETGVAMSYTGIGATFKNSSVTATVDKFSGKVSAMHYELNSYLTINGCKIEIDLSKLGSDSSGLGSSIKINTDIEMVIKTLTDITFMN